MHGIAMHIAVRCCILRRGKALLLHFCDDDAQEVCKRPMLPAPQQDRRPTCQSRVARALGVASWHEHRSGCSAHLGLQRSDLPWQRQLLPAVQPSGQ